MSFPSFAPWCTSADRFLTVESGNKGAEVKRGVLVTTSISKLSWRLASEESEIRNWVNKDVGRRYPK